MITYVSVTKYPDGNGVANFKDDVSPFTMPLNQVLLGVEAEDSRELHAQFVRANNELRAILSPEIQAAEEERARQIMAGNAEKADRSAPHENLARQSLIARATKKVVDVARTYIR